MSLFAPTDRLTRVALREDRPRARTPEIQQELDLAVFDLAEENRFQIAREDAPAGPYILHIGMDDRLLALSVTTEDGGPATELHLSLAPLRGIIKDYFAICESYFDAVKRLPPSKIEAIDMGRRGVHDEGARVLIDRLDGKVATDQVTARRLFTVICALQFRG
ncbi:MAG: UPF0262 family protein [Pseudomonadota bacterium]